MQRENIELIMMPTKSLGRFRRLLSGSVTAKVLQDVTCTVLTSAHEPDPTLISSSSHRSIVCAVDLNSETETVFRAAAFFAQTYGARVCLLHVDPSFKENGQQPTAQEVTNLFDQALGVCTPGTGLDISLRSLDATIPEGIRQIAIEQEADLVVVGRGHTKGTSSRAWSHLYTIIREAQCSVLSV